MRIRIDLKILIFLFLFYLTNQIKTYLVIMFFCIIHELGHIIIGVILKLRPEKLEIMPCGLTASFYPNFDDKNCRIKEIIVALAGPLTSVALAIFCSNKQLMYITPEEVVYANLLITLFNLIPIYPLDGGRIIKAILQLKLDNEKSEIIVSKISYIIIITITILSSIAIYYFKNIAIFLICIFLWTIILKEKNEKTLAIFQGK